MFYLHILIIFFPTYIFGIRSKHLFLLVHLCLTVNLWFDKDTSITTEVIQEYFK